MAYETQQYFETTAEGSNSYDIEEVKGELGYVSSSTESVQDRTQEVAGYVEDLLASLALARRAMDGVSGNFGTDLGLSQTMVVTRDAKETVRAWQSTL